MESHIVPGSDPLLLTFLRQIAHTGILDEISNLSGAVRHHIYWHSKRNKADDTINLPMLFFIYQTSTHGPQAGFRLCLINKGFRITAATKSEEINDDVEDDIDRLEREIPPCHMEVVSLGPKPPMTGVCEAPIGSTTLPGESLQRE